MGVTINGNNITITNATIEVVNGANPESGVSYIIITPDGGVGELPFMAQGLPGQPTLFPTITVVEMAPGDTAPTPNPTQTLLDPGGSGVPAKYALTFYVHRGQDGTSGSPSFAGASDLASSPALGVGTDKFILVYRNSDGKFVLTAQKVGPVSTPGANISATAFNNTNPRMLQSIAFGPQLFDWFPLVFAQTIVTGSVDTRVDLIARLNDQASGDQVGYAKGLTGVNAAGIQTVLIPAPPANQIIPGSYGKVLAGNTATIYLRAEQVAASSNSWSTPANPDTTFFVVVHPLP